MRIGELAAQAKLRTSAVRYYESVGLIPAPARVSGRRDYGDEALDRLRLIAALQLAGFSLGEIRSLISLLGSGGGSTARWRKAASSKLEELDAKMARLRKARRALERAIDCGCQGKMADCTIVD